MHHNKIISILNDCNINVLDHQYDDPLVNHGLDSLQLALFILALERIFNIKLALDSIIEGQPITVNRMNQLVEACLQS